MVETLNFFRTKLGMANGCVKILVIIIPPLKKKKDRPAQTLETNVQSFRAWLSFKRPRRRENWWMRRLWQSIHICLHRMSSRTVSLSAFRIPLSPPYFSDVTLVVCLHTRRWLWFDDEYNQKNKRSSHILEGQQLRAAWSISHYSSNRFWHKSSSSFFFPFPTFYLTTL